MKKITFSLLAILLLSGCRTAKPTASSETMADCITISADSSVSIRHDSIFISEKIKFAAEDKVEFVEGGGHICISADGSVVMAGVVAVRTSRSNSADCVKTMDCLSEKSQYIDSVLIAHQSTSHSESRPASSPRKWSWKSKSTAIALLLLLFSIIFFIIRRKIINH